MSVVMDNISGWVLGLFVDDFNNLYYSLFSYYQVMKCPLGTDNSTPVVVAGNGIAGNAPNQLFGPYGYAVDVKQNLYVADSNNNRVQYFPIRIV